MTGAAVVVSSVHTRLGWILASASLLRGSIIWLFATDPTRAQTATSAVAMIVLGLGLIGIGTAGTFAGDVGRKMAG
jgi:hypothetical protein